MSLSDNVSKAERTCKNCLSPFYPISNRQLVCKGCKPLSNKRESEDSRRKRFDLNKSKNANGWVNGVGVYRLIGKSDFCSKCDSDKFLVVHHKDEDRTNNDPSNLQTLCKKCHQKDHKCWQVLPRGKELSKLKKVQAAKAKRDRFGRFTKESPKV